MCVRQGLPKNSAEAVKFYEQAAQQDHGGALFNLGVCYSQGDGVPKNEATGRNCMRECEEWLCVSIQSCGLVLSWWRIAQSIRDW